MAQTPIDQNTWRDLYPAVGILILNWAYLESILEEWTALAYEKADGRHLAKKGQLPKSFGPKTEFLSKCFEKLDALVQFKDDGLRYLSEANRIFLTRSILTHGSIKDFDLNAKEIRFMRIDVDGKANAQIRKFNALTVAQIEKDAHDCIQLARNSKILESRMRSALSGK